MDAAALEKLSPAQLMELATKLGLTGNTGTEDADSILVTPDAGFVIKTFEVDPSKPQSLQQQRQASATAAPVKKVFINVCASDAVATFKTVKRLKEGSTSEEEEGIHIPVSVGPLRDDTDKKGDKCRTCDVIVHPDVLVDVERDGTGSFKHFVVELAIQYVERKYGLTLSHQYRLPAMKYKGDTISSQRIRRRAAVAGISEVKAGPQTAASPLSLLAQAGAVTQAAVPYDPAVKPRKANTIPAQMRQAPLQMDIRVLDPVAGDVQESLKKEVAEAQKDVGAADVASLNKASDGLMKERSSTRAEKNKARSIPAIPLVLVATARVPQVGSDSGEPAHVSLPLQLEQTSKGKQRATIHLPSTLPSTAPALDTIQEGDEDEADIHESHLGTGASLADHADALLLSFGCKQVVDAESNDCMPSLTAEAVSIQLSKTRTLLQVNISGYESLDIILPFPVSAEAGPSQAGFTECQVHAAARIVQLVLRRDQVAQRETALPPLPSGLNAALREGGAATAAEAMSKPLLMSILRQYATANADDFSPDVGSKQWLIAHAIALDEDDAAGTATSPPSTAAPTKPSSSSTTTDAQEEFAEDKFLRQDALSMHFLRSREEERAQREADQAAKQKQQQELYKIDPSVYANMGATASPADKRAVDGGVKETKDDVMPARDATSVLQAAKDLHVFDLL